MLSERAQARLQRQLSLRRALGVDGFPSLVLEVDGHWTKVPVDYQDHGATLRLITAGTG